MKYHTTIRAGGGLERKMDHEHLWKKRCHSMWRMSPNV